MVKIGDIEIAEFPLILAPMEDVSDPPFRYVCKKQGVDLMFTEFISSEGLIRDAVKSKQKLDIFEYERPVGIQIFGNNIESMEKATELASAVNPDIIDINYGCPVKKVACKGAGAGILQDIDKMVRMTKAIVDSTNLPVTVKTRLGWDEDTKYVVEVAEKLQDVGIKAISVHGRTRKQMYKGEADWSLIGDIKNNQRMHIPVFGNGDVNTPEIAKEKKDRYGVDGIMIGRASIGYPWIFREIKHYLETGEHLAPPTFAERKEACISHFEKSMHWKGDWKGVVEMRRHYANYFKGIRNFKPTRMELVTEADPDKIRAILNNLKEEHFLEPAAQ